MLPFIAKIGSAVGKIAPAVLDVLGRRQQNQAQKQQAKDAMAFSERMANTSAQRAKADFEAAGFNPALAYGTQAANPVGQQASIGNELSGAVSSAQAARAANAQLQIVQEQLATQRAVSSKARADAEVATLSADRQRLEQMVWQSIARGSKVDMSSPLARSINAQFEAAAMSPQSISASNSALAAQARAQSVTADIQQFEADYLRRLDTSGGNVAKIFRELLPLLRMFK